MTDDSVGAVLDDIRNLITDGNRIVNSGRARFFDAADRTLRLAAKAIVIGFQSAADRLPDRFRQEHPAVAWAELRAMSTYLARHDSSVDYEIVWNALTTDFPQLGRQLGL
ncbi:MAG: HepT-like ribonuclease domain-containing protein [Terrimesophilobacter sp.]